MGRFGKYGEIKRYDRLRQSKTRILFAHNQVKEQLNRGPVFKKETMPNIRIKIRTARMTDAEFIGRLSEKVFHIYGPYEEMVSWWFESEMTLTSIAILDNKRVGFAMIGNPFPEQALKFDYELLAIGVEPEKQGMGIGRILVRDIKRKAGTLKIRRLFLHTAKDNLPALKLFERNGFQPLEIKKEFYPAGQDAVVMCKEIDIIKGC